MLIDVSFNFSFFGIFGFFRWEIGSLIVEDGFFIVGYFGWPWIQISNFDLSRIIQEDVMWTYISNSLSPQLKDLWSWNQVIE